ncbi:uncharacterized protein LOC123582296 [Leopardus geoffroyi]|uniref:uncharacterized protein LOC123582296 n=1 Tax=Leopardus geoffroyi TaxID=46844 RepID=UPI001E25E6C5|nr:uncharacterized protein LOC123582296 [Leopardus geoffroyi]
MRVRDPRSPPAGLNNDFMCIRKTFLFCWRTVTPKLPSSFNSSSCTFQLSPFFLEPQTLVHVKFNSFILQVKKRRSKEVKGFAQGHIKPQEDWFLQPNMAAPPQSLSGKMLEEEGWPLHKCTSAFAELQSATAGKFAQLHRARNVREPPAHASSEGRPRQRSPPSRGSAAGSPGAPEGKETVTSKSWTPFRENFSAAHLARQPGAPGAARPGSRCAAEGDALRARRAPLRLPASCPRVPSGGGRRGGGDWVAESRLAEGRATARCPEPLAPASDAGRRARGERDLERRGARPQLCEPPLERRGVHWEPQSLNTDLDFLDLRALGRESPHLEHVWTRGVREQTQEVPSVSTTRRWLSANQEEPSPDVRPGGTLSLDFRASRTVKIKVYDIPL